MRGIDLARDQLWQDRVQEKILIYHEIPVFER